MRAGRDVVGQAQTGTGKTAAFGIPLVENIDSSARKPQALVLVPTRELAVQVRGELSSPGTVMRHTHRGDLRRPGHEPPAGGSARGVHIVVATPGRLMDHMERGTIEIGQVRSVVLDEADQMLDIGFAEDIDRILRHTLVPARPAFLCHHARPIKKLARRYLKEPAWIRVGGDAEPVEEVKQLYYEVAGVDRPSALDELLRQPASSARPWYSAGPKWESTGCWLTSKAVATTPRPSTAT